MQSQLLKKMLKILFKFIFYISNFNLISTSQNYSAFYQREDFLKLWNFICEVAKDVVEKDPDLRTIAIVELKNNFPSAFSARVLKCLPVVPKVILMPHTNYEENATIFLPKQSLIICLADERDSGNDLAAMKVIFNCF